MPKLPKNAKIGTKVERKIKGKRTVTFEKVKPHGRNNNLTWRIVSNESKVRLKIYLIFGAIIIGIAILIFLQVNGIL